MYAEVCALLKMTETYNISSKEQTEVCMNKSLAQSKPAYRHVKKIKGAGGIDGLQVDEPQLFLKEQR